MRRIHALTATAAVLAAVLLAGCGDDDMDGMNHGQSSPSPSRQSASPRPTAQAFNTFDVAFAKDMISHHRQAVMMASLAAERNASPAVKALAAKIEKAQQPEIDTMSGWLRAWGKPIPPESMDHGAAGHEGMRGMMTPAQMEELNAATGAEFDRMFLAMMIDHHNGAIQMAITEQQKGVNADAKALAAKIEKDQTAEVVTMGDLLR